MKRLLVYAIVACFLMGLFVSLSLAEITKTTLSKEQLRVEAEEDPLACALFLIINARKPVFDQQRRLSKVAEGYLKRKEYGLALEVANLLKEATSERVETLCKIAVGYSEFGEKEKAANLISQALEEAKRIENGYYKYISLGDASLAYEQIGQKDKASLILSEVFNTIKGFVGAEILAKIAVNYYNSGYKDRASELLSQVWDSIKNEKRVNKSVIAIAFAKTGQKEKALEILESLITVKPLRGIADDYAQIGEFEKAIQFAEKIEDILDKADVLADIAIDYGKAGYKDKARAILTNILSQVISVTQTQENRHHKRNTIEHIAEAYCEIGDYEQAIQAAGGYFPRARMNQCIEAGKYEEAVQVIVAQECRAVYHNDMLGYRILDDLIEIVIRFAESGKNIDARDKKILQEIIRAAEATEKEIFK